MSYADTQGPGWAAFEDSETLLAMDDTAFKRAVTRMMASRRKIFSSQQKNWASVRLKANEAATRRDNDLLQRIAAERAERVDREGHTAAPIRDRCRASALALQRTGAVEASTSFSATAAPKLVAVTVKKFAAGPGAVKLEEQRQQTRLVALPKVQNVPRYTSYMYAAYQNSHVRDEVRRRLLFPDQEGEMRVGSDNDEISESDSESESDSDSDSSDSLSSSTDEDEVDKSGDEGEEAKSSPSPSPSPSPSLVGKVTRSGAVAGEGSTERGRGGGGGLSLIHI